MAKRATQNKKGEAAEAPIEISEKRYSEELARLQVELAHLQAWVKNTGQRIVIIFEGRDAAGKGVSSGG